MKKLTPSMQKALDAIRSGKSVMVRGTAPQGLNALSFDALHRRGLITTVKTFARMDGHGFEFHSYFFVIAAPASVDEMLFTNDDLVWYWTADEKWSETPISNASSAWDFPEDEDFHPAIVKMVNENRSRLDAEYGTGEEINVNF